MVTRSRRRHALVSALALALSLLTVSLPAEAKSKDKHSLPPRDTSGVDKIVVVMMENRSFDHLLGWHPTADGQQRGLWYTGPAGFPHPTRRLAPDYTGC